MQQILKALFRNATSAMFQNKKLKRNATSAIAEVAEVALCASDCALPTSAFGSLEMWALVHCYTVELGLSSQRSVAKR